MSIRRSSSITSYRAILLSLTAAAVLLGIGAVRTDAAGFVDTLKAFFGITTAEQPSEGTTAPEPVMMMPPPPSSLIDPAGLGGFESGFTGWTVVNGATGNKWFTGTAAGVNAGSNAAFAGSSATTYTDGVAQTVSVVNHFYKDISFPVGETIINLSFSYKQPSLDGTFDNLKVFLVPTSTTPVAGTALSSGQIGLTEYPVVAQAVFGTFAITIPASAAGTTQRLVFSWKNDSATPYGSGAIDSISLTSLAPVPLVGTKTIKASGGDYSTFTAAINDLNLNGVGAGGVTFNVDAGFVSTEDPPAITATGTVANPIVFQKSGAGANPILKPSGTSGTADFGIAISGGDYITFDGVDITINSGSAVEYGYLVRNSSATDGAQNNTIKNSSIALSRTNTSSIGVFQTSTTTGGGVVPTNATGANSTNKYYNLTIQNVYAGIHLSGTGAFPDLNCEVGITSGGVTTVGAATANDIGNGTSQTWGIRGTAQSGVKIFNTEVRNVTGTSTSTTDGISVDNPSDSNSSTVSNATNEISNNKIHDIKSTSTSSTSHVVSGIRVSNTTSATSVSRVYNNFIYALDNASTTTTTRQIIGIRIQNAGSGAGSTHNIDFNTVRLAPAGIACSNANLETGTTSGPIMKFRNNIFANFTGAQSTQKHYAIAIGSASTLGPAGSLSDRNDLYISNTTNGLVAVMSSTDRSNLAAWQAGVTSPAGAGDPNGISSDPSFLSATDLHISAGSTALNNGSFFSGAITWAGLDIDAQTRPEGATNPDIGADEFYALPGSLQLSSTTYSGNEGTTLSATVNRVGGSSGTVGLTYALADGSGAVGGAACGAGIDYVNTGGTLSFGDGVTSQPINVSLCSDSDFDGGETFTITLSLPTGGASLGTPTASTATINNVVPPFNGSYNVGTGQNFTSLTNTGGIFEAINSVGATGNITIEITSSLTGETGNVALNQIAGGFTVLIKPTGGTRSISGTNAAGALIKLNGADGVTIDGSTSGGTDRSLTITNSGTSSPTVVSIQSLGTGLGANTNTIKNCNLSTAASSGTGYGVSIGSSVPGAAGADNDTTTIQNNVITGATVGVYASGTGSGPDDGLVISGNNITSSATIQNYGIQVAQSTGSTISGNTVSVTSSGTVQPTAISLETGYVSSSVSRNTITAALATNTGGYGGRGITIGTGTVSSSLSIANNIIYGVNGSNFSSFTNSSSMGIGIGMIGGSTTLTTVTGGVNLYFNSVNMAGSYDRASACLTAALYVGSGASALDIRNNVLVNSLNNINSGGTGSKNYAIYSAATSSAFTNINYNDYFVSGTQGVLGFIGSDRTNLAGIVTGFGGNANSVNGNPQFISDTNLHINTALTTPVESGGTPISGITLDIDGDIRNGTTPDIGADEGSFIAPVANDVQATAFIDPSNGGSKAAGASFSPQASFTNNGTVNQTSVPVRYRICTDASCTTELYNNATTIATLNSGVTATATFASTSLSAGSYTIKAKAELVGDTASANDEITGTFTVESPLSGNYTVGSGGNFTSLTNAGGLFDRINSLGLSGTVTVDITSDLTGETGAIALNEFASPYTLTIRPSGAARTITGANATNALIRLNGADRVTINGTATPPGLVGGNPSLRELTVINTDPSVNASGIAIHSGANGAQDNKIKNINVRGVDPATSFIGIAIGGATPGAVGADNDGNHVENCSIQKFFYGIYASGASSANKDTGTVIEQNDLSGTGADRVTQGGIIVFNQDGVQITENSIGGISSNLNGADTFGVGLGAGAVDAQISTTATTSGGIINANVARNKIIGVVNTSSSGYGSTGIAVAGDTGGANSIVNNMISGVVANATSPDNSVGIFVAGVAGSSTRLYNNSVAMTGARGSTGSQIGSYGVAITGSNPAVELKNNIFYTIQTSAGGANAKSYAIGLAYSTYTNLDSNNNAFWSTGANDGGFRVGGLGATATDLAAISNWRTTTGKDADSIEFDPAFTDSLANLHIKNDATDLVSPVARKGVTISGITSDYDGDTRKATPDIGADEFNTYLLTAAAGTGGTVTPVAVTTVNPGASTAITATPNGGYNFVNWTTSDAGVTFGDANLASTTAALASGNATVTANFAPATYSITGTITEGANPLSGVTISSDNCGATTTNGIGVYTLPNIAHGTSCTVTPSLTGYTFAPPSRSYSNLSANQTAQDYAATPNAYTISGAVTLNGNGLNGVAISGGACGSTSTDALGLYTLANIAPGTSCTVTPSLAGYAFAPANRPYANLSANQTGQDYAATANPTVTNVNPASGPAAGGTSVIITGTDLTGATAVTFGGTAAATFTVNSNTQITATTPSHAGGPVSVEVTTPGGTSAANTLFTFIPAILMVNNNGDGTDFAAGNGVCETASGNGICTLRAAIQEANALSGTQTITFDASTNGTPITADIPPVDPAVASDTSSVGDLDVTDALTITGNGSGNTVIQVCPTNGGCSFEGTTPFLHQYSARVFDIAAGTFTVSGVTIRHGANEGGGILLHTGTLLDLSNSTVGPNSGSGNGSAGIRLGGDGPPSPATITNCLITGNSDMSGIGGGIGGRGALTITDSLITNNSAYQGGGIGLNGDLTLTNSTVSGNSAGNKGAGIYLVSGASTITGSTISGNSASFCCGAADGGGIYAGGSSSTGFTVGITNSTIGGNAATGLGGAIYNDFGQFALTNVTIAGNTATGGATAVHRTANGSVTVKNTILDGTCSSTLTSLGYNLATDSPGNTCGANGTADLLNASAGLGTFGNHGGPTETYSLLANSPARDNGSAVVSLTTDQRGAPRPHDDPNIPNAAAGDGSDIGAYEDQVDVSFYSITGTVTLGAGTLSGVTISGGACGSTTTDGSGVYTLSSIAAGTSCTVTPSLTGYTFSPPSRSYANLAANQTAQDYAATLNTYTITGTVTEGANPLSGVTMTGDTCGSTTTNGSGVYTLTASHGTTCTITPSLSGYTFSPPSRTHTNVTANATGQDFAATADNTAPTITAINDTSVTEGNTLTVPVTVSDAETTVGMTLTATSSNQTAIPNANIVVTGSGANWSLAITPADDTASPVTITVTATDASSLADTELFDISVGPAVCIMPPGGMVSWHPSEGDADDIWGANNGTLEGGVTANGAGKVGTAFNFTGSGQYVNVPHRPEQNTGAQLTLDAWIKPANLTANHNSSIITKRTTGDQKGYILELTHDTAGFRFRISTDAGTFDVTATGVLTANTWQHVAGTYDGSVMKTYVNGVEVGSTAASGTINPVTSDLVIGQNTVNGVSYSGLIDEVEIFNTALSGAEIESIYDAAAAGKCKVYHTVTATGDGNGNVTYSPSRAGNQYLRNSTVTLTAVPNAFYSFANWSGDNTSSTNPLPLTVDADKTLQAHFSFNNTVPTVDAGAATGSVDEGGTFTRGGSFTDPDLQMWTATVDYGDGSGVQSLTLNPDKTFNLSHAYADGPALYTITVSVSDGTASGGDTIDVTVNNVAPTAVFAPATAQTITTGDSVTLSLSSPSDPSGADTSAGFHYIFTCATSGMAPVPSYPSGGTATSQICNYPTAGTYTAEGIILDKDSGFSSYTVEVTVIDPASYAINSVSHNEGATGVDTSYDFTVTKTGDLTRASTLSFTYQAVSSNNGDYSTVTTSPLSFGVGVSTQTVTVTVHGDGTYENNETFNVVLGTADNGGTIGTGTGTGTIVNDDAAPVISIADYTYTDGDLVASGFAVTFTGDTEVYPISVHYATSNDSATAGSDYNAASGTVTFNSATTEYIIVSLIADNGDEPTETFFVDLDTPVNATIGDGHAVGTITNDDNSPVASSFSTTATAGTAKTITLSATDANNDLLSFSIASGPGPNGSLGPISSPVCSAGTCTATVDYTASPISFSGPDSFTYQASDGTNQSNVATVSITVSAVPPQIAYVDDDWSGATEGSDPDGAGPATNYGYDSFDTIQEGVSKVDSGGDVAIFPGNYTDPLTVDRPMTVEGSFTLTGSLTVTAADVHISPGFSPGIINTGDLQLNPAALAPSAGLATTVFDVELNGPAPGTGYDQLNVTGTVELTNTDLNLTVGYAPASGATYTIINNDGADAIIGTFNGLAEGATVSAGGYNFTISYIGGTDSNDVVLTLDCANNVSLPTTTSSTGATVNIPITTTDVTGQLVLSSDMVFEYDETVLDPTEANITVTKGSAVPNATTVLTVNSSTPGKIEISLFGSQPFTTGVLVNIQMKVIGLSGSSTPLTLSTFKYNNEQICADVTNGLLSIVSTPTTTDLTSSANPSTYGDPVTFTATVSPNPGGGLVNFTIDGNAACTGVTVNGSGQAQCGPFSNLNAGPHAVVANYLGTTGYDPSSDSISQAVNPRPATWITDPASKTYGDLDPSPLTTGASAASPNNFLAGDNVTATYVRIGGETASPPTYHITATLNAAPGVLNNYIITNDGAEFTINKRAATWVTDAASKTYGDLDPSPLTTGASAASPNNFLPADNVTATYARVAGESASPPTYHITATLNAAAGVLDNYIVTNAGAEFTINKRAATWVANPASKTYGDLDPSPLTTGASAASPNNFLAADNVTATYARVAGESASPPTYHITATLNAAAGVLDNYVITNDGAEFTINKRSATWVTNAASKTYGDLDPSPLTTGASAASPNNFLAADNVTATYARVAGESASPPTYHITATLNAAAGVLDNYIVTNAGAEFTINKRAATWVTNPASKTYGDLDPSPLTTGASAASPNNFLAADNVTATYARVAGESSSPPTYHITATLNAAAGVLDNYIVTNAGAEFTINKRAATWVTNAASKTYGDLDPSPLTMGASAASPNNFLAADNVTATYARVAGESASPPTYHITATLNAAAGVLDNYIVTNAGAEFTINKRPATWVTNAASKTYGDLDPSPLTTGASAASPNNFLLADNVTATYARVAGESASPPTYHITATLNAAAGVLDNYIVTNAGAEFTINKRAATWVTDPASKTYGDADPIPLTTGASAASPNNFLAADNVTATYARVAGESASPPTYHITATLNAAAGVLDNYVITNAGAEFTINKRAATWVTNPNSKTYGALDPSPLTTGASAASPNNFLAADNVTATYARVSGEAPSPPTYHITATLNAAPGILDNYIITNNGAEFTIISGTISGTVNYAVVPSKLVPDVQVSDGGSGSQPVSDLTDANGNYLLTNFGAGPYTITPSKPTQPCGNGNLNGIYADDAAKIAQHVVHLITLSPAAQQAGQVSNTGSLSSLDAAFIARTIVCLPSGGNLTGQWRFSPTSVPHPSGVLNQNLDEDYTATLMGDVDGDWDPLLPGRPAPEADRHDPNTVWASLPTVAGTAGSTVTLPLTLEKVKGVGVTSYQFDIEYDPAVVEPDEMAVDLSQTLGPNLSAVWNVVEPGLLKVVVFGAFPATGDGVYANLRFTVTGGTGSATPFNIRGFRLNDGSMPVAGTSGQLVVTSTANDAVLTGRLLSASGRGVSEAVVTITSTAGRSMSIKSDHEGRFGFSALNIGQTYTVSVMSERYRFTPTTVSILQSATEMEMIANP